MRHLKHLLRWMRLEGAMTARDMRAQYLTPATQGETMLSPDEFDQRLLEHDREMAMIQEIVASIRHERIPPPSSPTPPPSHTA